MSDNGETVPTTDDKTEKKDTSSSQFGNVNTSTPVRLFGQFKQNGSGFNNFGQLSSNENNSSTTYFTSTLSKISSTNGGGFGSSSTSLAASLAPLTSNQQLFGGSSSTTPSTFTTLKTNEEEEEENNDDEEDEEEEEGNKTTSSLFETAAEYEAKRASTHPTAHIHGDTSTGEEHETTKFQMAGKLFMYNSEQQQFVERGNGVFKINESHDPSDCNKLQARLIMRLDKSFRVILNSPVFPKMTVERATDRSVRFGAQDESQLRIFIIKASANDCTNLCKELQSRIQTIERQQTASSNINSPVQTNASASNSSPTQNLPVPILKRSYSKDDSDTSDHSNDLSKKSKKNEGYRDEKDDTSDEDSVESTKTGEQETIT